MPTRVRTNADVSVAVEAPARLHMGFFDLNGSLGRKFGSLGLALDALSTRVVASRGGAASTGGARISGLEADRAARYVDCLRDVIDLPGDLTIQVESAIPSHAGLGSGTQLALALGTAISRLVGADLTPREIAHLLDRGARSGIGVAAFEQGGFVVDGGRGASDAPPPLISRLPFPPAWRVLLILDPHASGLHGHAETSAFAELPPFPDAQAERLCRAMMMQALPALAEADLDTFGRAVTDLQRTIGDYFAPAQGGRFTSAAVSRALDALGMGGVACLGQSSWGPTGFAVLANEAAALHWRERLTAEFPTLDLRVCSARNHGADIRSRTSAEMRQTGGTLLDRPGSSR